MRGTGWARLGAGRRRCRRVETSRAGHVLCELLTELGIAALDVLEASRQRLVLLLEQANLLVLGLDSLLEAFDVLCVRQTRQ